VNGAGPAACEAQSRAAPSHYGETVEIYDRGIGSHVLASAAADMPGCFTVDGSVPESADGPRTF
jgi:hypothetical protein